MTVTRMMTDDGHPLHFRSVDAKTNTPDSMSIARIHLTA